MHIIKEKDKITVCWERFRGILSANTVAIPCKPGFRGGNVEVEAHWSDNLEMWSSFRLSDKALKFWSAFGLERPVPSGSVPITAEINFGYDWSNIQRARMIQGIFLENEQGKISIAHRGRFGDVRKISPSLFLKQTRFQVIEVQDGRCVSRMALIGALDDPALPAQVRDLVQEVDVLKNF